MNAVQQTIRILVVILLVHHTRCQDGYSDRDILRYQQMAANEGQLAAMAGYSNNVMQRDPNNHAVSSVNIQYHMTDDTDNSDYHRADRTRTRKVYRIKNPFQQQPEDNRQDDTTDPRDSSTGASNQYASMQYSLPPEDFLQQMRAESQFYQQSTPAPNLGYTATPQPQYQYSTISPSSYDNNNQQASQISQISQIPQLEPKSHTQYLTNTYQYNAPNSFSFDGVQSTPSSITPFISTALPSGQFVSTPSNYVSSASSIFLSSPPNLQYVSSPLAAIQTGSPDYSSNRVTTTIGSNGLSYDNNDQNKKLQIDHYDNSANGIRYPINVQRQYQSEYGSSTPSPTSSPDSREQWQNNMNTVNAAAKSLHDVTYTQYQNYPYQQQDNSNNNGNVDHANSETHRIGNMPSANNIYLNYMQPDYQAPNNARTRTRDLEQQTGQPDYYSNGEYGWKLEDKKQPSNNDAYLSGNYRYQTIGLQSDSGEAVSQMNFHMDTSKQYSNNYDQVSKSNSDNINAQEFAKAAARVHDNMKQQQNVYGNSYDNHLNSNNNNPNVLSNGNSYYSNYEKQKSKYVDSSSQSNYYNQQPDLITASPYYYSRDNNVDNKPKPSFDHAKALKNIVPIDVSNVVNSESQKGIVNDGTNRYSIQNYDRDQLDRQQYRPLTDSFYKDKNAIYGLNIKTKPDEYQGPESSKLFDPNVSYYGKQQQTQEPAYNQGFSGAPQRYVSQSSGNSQDNLQSSANIQQQGLQRPQNQMPTDINSILKLNDVPYQLTQNFSPDALKFHNINFDRGSIPSPLPMRINQDVGTHQLDVTSNLLSKLMSKQPGFSLNRPDLDPQAGSLVSTINGFKVANPYNVDLKLVADMLKGKSSIDDHLLSFRDQYSKPSPLKFDLSQLQLLLKNDNTGSLPPVSDGLSVLSNPFLEIYNSGRYPYQKYSRSQEEEEPLVPIADASSNHPIGAVMEQDDPTNEREGSTGPDATALNEGNISVNHEDDRPRKPFHSHRSTADRYRHPNSLMSGRHSYQRRYPKSDSDEPYPLLKPPPLHSLRGRVNHQKHNRRRRVNKPKIFRIMKAEPLFEADTDDESYESPVPVVLRPPAPVIESKSDVDINENGESS